MKNGPAGPFSVSTELLTQAFLAQALHQPLALTCLPANSGQPPQGSVALAWYSAQLLHFCSLACLGYFLASTLVVSCR